MDRSVRPLYAIALGLMSFSLFVLWVWTGLIGVVAAASLTHLLLRFCETRRDAEAALVRKASQDEIRRAFSGRDGPR